MEAAGWGTARRVAELVRAGADPNLPDREGSTALYRASVQDMAGNIRVLTAAGADPHLESGTGDEGLPLCGAACWGHDAAVRELLAAGADPQRREDGGRGRSAMEWAEAGGYGEVIEVMRDGVSSPGADQAAGRR